MFYVKLFFSISLLFLSGCGEESSYKVDDDNVTLSSVKGTLVDGYISGATVCLDLNNNSVCDGDEPQTITDTKGSFSIENTQLVDDTFVTVLGTGGVDTSTNQAFNEQIKNIFHTQARKSAYVTNISPVTDLVATSFFILNTNDLDALNSAKATIQALLSLQPEELSLDPMTDVKVFSATQEIQNIKHFVINIANETLGYANNSFNHIKLENEVKIAMLEQNLNIENILSTLETDLNTTFNEEKKYFATRQIKIIRDSLLAIFDEVSLEDIDIDQLQSSLATITEESIKSLIPSYDGTTVPKSDTNETAETNTTIPIDPNSDFNTVDALYDENACKKSATYMTLESSSFSPAAQTDPINVLSIKSNYPYNATVEKTKVTLFYPELTEVEEEGTLVIIRANYYFNVNKAWVNNSNNRVYVKTAREPNGLYSCYRFDINSEKATEIKDVKVYSYR